MTVIEIRPHRWGWKAFEAPGVEPVFPKKDQAIDYALQRACFRSGELRIFDSTGSNSRFPHRLLNQAHHGHDDGSAHSTTRDTADDTLQIGASSSRHANSQS